MQYYNSRNALSRISQNKFLKDTVTDPLKAPSLDLSRAWGFFSSISKIAGILENYSYKISITFWRELEIPYHYTKFQLINAKPPCLKNSDFS